MKQIFKVAVSWEVCGEIEVEAESVREAVNMVNEDPDFYQLPSTYQYVDSSFQADYDMSMFINNKEYESDNI